MRCAQAAPCATSPDRLLSRGTTDRRRGRGPRFPGRAAGVLLGGLALLAAPGFATQVKIFQAQSQQAFLAGTLEGVSIDPLGRLELAPRVEELTAIGEPFLLAAAVHPDGWVVGTGNAGRVLKVDRRGKVTELFAAPEPEVFAVWADADGTVFAGTSPNGKVYRIPARIPAGIPAGAAKAPQAEIFFEPNETYIWALARGADGALLVATGTQGKLFRVEGKGRGAVAYDSEDTHVRSLKVLPGGDALLGTAGEGLILRLGKNGEVRTLYDAQQPEVVALAAAPDGTCYAAVVASEASLLDLSKPPSGSGAGSGSSAAGGGAAGSGGGGGQSQDSQAEGEGSVTVMVEGEPAPPAAGRKEPSGPRSEVLRIAAAGAVERIWSFNEETVYALLSQDDSLWVGTGLEGKLYRWNGSQMLLAKDVDERQVVALMPGEPGPSFATTNAAALFRVTAGRERRGTYTSAPLDAGQIARFGSFRWRGETPEASAVRFSFRSGVSAEPDRTWSPWTEAKAGEELSLAGVPRGRYVQWRAELAAGRDGNVSPRIYGADLSFRQENLSPRIEGVSALEPGQILVPANFNPSNQVYEPAHPNREGIFTTLEVAADDLGGRGVKPLWKRGFRSLRWTASDPNGDKLTYALSFRPGDPVNGDAVGGWMPMADDLTEDHYSFDATVLPDGVYRFRLSASDAESNDPDSALATEQVSDPVVIDHTVPKLSGVERRGGELVATVGDEWSPVREAVYSVDAGEWKPARAVDGLLDGERETLIVDMSEGGAEAGGARGTNGQGAGPAKPGEHSRLVLLRITDAAYNVVTFDLSKHGATAR